MTDVKTFRYLSLGNPAPKEGQFTVGNDPTIYDLSDQTKSAISADPARTTQLIAAEMFEKILANIRSIYGDS
jgi:hypothetical protein